MTNDIDPRIQQLSYSYRTLLHGCPKRYQLTKIATVDREKVESVTFAYGHAVGAGIQAVLENKTWNQVILDMLKAWDFPDILAEETKSCKSFFYAIFAVQKFESCVRDTILADYELAVFQGKPAVELSFRIQLRNGYNYTGHVDVVLKHKTTGQYMVLELKTTGLKTVNYAQYKNSSQAIGYSIILDTIAPGQSSYELLYLVYISSTQEYYPLPFIKNYSERAAWIKELLLDCDILDMYEAQEHYPTHGEFCFSFFRECEWLSNCKLGIEFLRTPIDPDAPIDRINNTNEFTLELSLLDLVDAQLNRQEI